MSVGRSATRVVATASPRESVLEVARRLGGHDADVIELLVEEAESIGEILRKVAPSLATST